MQRLAKILYIMNSITCIFIGLLHTHAHYTSLITEELSEMMNHTIVVTGMETNVFNLWQGMSLMMGLLLIIVGLSHLLIICRLTKKEAFPPIGGSLILILMLVFVIYAGYNFFGGWQVYGGGMGILLQSICLALSIKGK